MNNSRRSFIKKSTTLAAASGLSTAFPNFYGMAATRAGQKIRVGAIGINGMGWADLNAILKHPDVVCTALCDVDKNVLDKRSKELLDRGIKPMIWCPNNNSINLFTRQ